MEFCPLILIVMFDGQHFSTSNRKRQHYPRSLNAPEIQTHTTGGACLRNQWKSSLISASCQSATERNCCAMAFLTGIVHRTFQETQQASQHWTLQLTMTHDSIE